MTIADAGRSTVGWMLEAVFPRRCAGCGRRGRWVCPECEPTLQRLGIPACGRCGAQDRPSCCCRDLDWEIERVRASAWYEGWLRSAIVAFKYEGESARAAHLAELIIPLLAEFPPDAVLIPVPLHPKRERARGYNQSRLLALGVSAASGRPMVEVLRRVADTPQQMRLDATDRRANVAAAFAPVPGVPIAGRAFVLVDDVMTTGATLSACAATLGAAGAAFVGAVAVARDR